MGRFFSGSVYKTRNSKIQCHVEPNEGVLNNQHYLRGRDFKSQFRHLWMRKFVALECREKKQI